MEETEKETSMEARPDRHRMVKFENETGERRNCLSTGFLCFLRLDSDLTALNTAQSNGIAFNELKPER
jgi:hypothetical protein